MRNAKLHRLQRKGLLPTKAELSALCQQAVQSHPIRKLPTQQPEAEHVHYPHSYRTKTWRSTGQ